MATSQKPFLVGAHVSSAGGIYPAPERAHDIGANCVQVFTTSPQTWSKVEIADDRVKLYMENEKKFGILSSVIHAQYLVNLAAEDQDHLARSRVSITVDLNMAAKIKATGVVVHLGSHLGRGWVAVQDQVAKEIAGLLESTPDDAVFLIENAAGMNGKIGSDLREITWLIRNLKAGKRLGWCLDTCHAFAAGYALVPTDGEKYIFDWINELKLEDTLKVVHVNDTRDVYFSHKDRHANLGEGNISLEMMKDFVNKPLVRHLPLILEVPGPNKKGPESKDISDLKKLLE